eukprot:1152769-Prorocentrum_minimum.AAC.2
MSTAASGLANLMDAKGIGADVKGAQADDKGYGVDVIGTHLRCVTCCSSWSARSAFRLALASLYSGCRRRGERVV